jgi:alpha-L-arabinofuranosidase
MGIQMIRQGGTVSQTFTWKDWRGAPWARASLGHVWGDSLVSGWGPFEFIDMANAIGIVPVVTLAYDTNSAADWADLVEYLWADDTTTWGSVRIHNDSHAAPFNITIFEIGNEEQNPDFVSQVVAMEARRKAVGAPNMTYLYPTNEGVSVTAASALVAAGVAPHAIAPDCHVGDGGAVDCARNDFAANAGFRQQFINCEVNAGTSAVQRMLTEAADLQSWFGYGAGADEDPTRLIARAASFCSERSGHYDAFDQGITFFLPNMSWLQPPGYVHAMLQSRSEPRALALQTTPDFPASAQLSDDGKRLVVQVVNANPAPGSVTLLVSGFAPSAAAVITMVNGTSPSQANTPADPNAVAPYSVQQPWTGGGTLALSLPPYSFTIVTTEGAASM